MGECLGARSISLVFELVLVKNPFFLGHTADRDMRVTTVYLLDFPKYPFIDQGRVNNWVSLFADRSDLDLNLGLGIPS